MAVLETKAIADPDRDCLASLQGDYYYVTIAPPPVLLLLLLLLWLRSTQKQTEN